jgi:L-lactate utilization protein LutB
MENWKQLANDATIQKTIDSLKTNGIEAEVVESGREAKKRVLEIIPHGAEVMTMTSVTLDDTGISQEINESKNSQPLNQSSFP